MSRLPLFTPNHTPNYSVQQATCWYAEVPLHVYLHADVHSYLVSDLQIILTLLQWSCAIHWAASTAGDIRLGSV